MAAAILEFSRFDSLLEGLRARGYRPVGPTRRDGAIVLDELRSAADLPSGWIDEQEPGRYRLAESGSPEAFAHTHGPSSWKRFLHPPALTLWRARLADGQLSPGDGAPPRHAFVGVRACDLAAIARLDGVMAAGPLRDAPYVTRREGAFLVAVNCTRAGGTCFCASLGTGPRAQSGFDVALTELVRDGVHLLLAEAGSERGEELLAALPVRPATAEESLAADEAVSAAARGMGKTLETRGLREALLAAYEHPRWDEVARRCLACANCTLVCPTCFCFTIEDTTDLAGEEAARVRRWDSCFGLEFSFIHGGSVRGSPGARYRHWLLHKLATWHDQFGSSGCVGCGRCITWCPVGIDITQEAEAVRGALARGG
jgi:sulfhydrogenase subunit beta (sulfur reductase)